MLLWWRDGDGDLVDTLVDALGPLADNGVVWLLTPKAGRDGPRRAERDQRVRAHRRPAADLDGQRRQGLERRPARGRRQRGGPREEVAGDDGSRSARRRRTSTLKDQNNQEVRLSRLPRPRAVLLVFYPFAFTGTCQGELAACGTTCRLQNDGVQVLTVSVDSVYAHKVWADREGYDFPLLADFWPHGAVAQAYGVFNDVGRLRQPRHVPDRPGRRDPVRRDAGPGRGPRHGRVAGRGRLPGRRLTGPPVG